MRVWYVFRILGAGGKGGGANAGQMYRATIRATDESVPPVLMKLMEEMLAQGVERI